MGWQEIFKSRSMTAEQAAKLVTSGDVIFTPLGLGQPSMQIMDAIADRDGELTDIEWFNCLTLRPYKLFKPEYRKNFRIISGFMSSPSLMALARTEYANYYPGNASDGKVRYTCHRKVHYPRRMGSIFQVTPPDDHGYVSIGLDSFYTPTTIDDADYLIGQVNPMMPRTYGPTTYHVSQFAAFWEHAEPMIALPTPPATDVEMAMARNILGLLKDRDCIQIGIGAVPAMVSKLLVDSGLRDLGVHTEMVPAGSAELVEKGIITGKYKKTHTGKVITAFTLGDKDTYDFCSNNPMVEFYPTTYTNNFQTIAKEQNVVAINGSIEVDLLGQVVSESIGDTMITGTGGQLDFTIGAFWSPGGRAVNLVPSTTSDGKISRIVPFLKPGARVTVPRNYAGYIVTEYGVADLYGRSEPERAAELIKVAHPKFREELEKSARERHLVLKKVF